MPIKELRSFFEKQGIESKLVEINKFIQHGFKIREYHLNKNIPAAS